MAGGDCEPINIFSHRIDPRGVLQVLRSLGTVTVTGPEDDWQEATITLKKKGFFSRAPVLVIGHDSEYYADPGWQQQVRGMQGYFARFPDTPTKPQVLKSLGVLRFALSFPKCDLDIDSADLRVDVVYAICRHLDGVIFTPTALRDAQGQILIDARGEYDPAAMFPRVLPIAEVQIPNSNTATTPADDDEEETPPPTPERVARRALALTAVAARATLELDREKVEQPDSQRQRMLKWIDALGIGDELEPEEWKVLQRPVGKLDERSFINSMWRVEGLAVLAWALQRYELPPDDELVIVDVLYQAMGFLDAAAGRAFLADPHLRSTEELAEMQTHLLMLHWRVRNYTLRPTAMDFREFSKNCWIGSFDISRFRLIDNDLAIGETSISQSSPDDFNRVQSLAMERHLASNWLQGYSRIYSETDTST